MILYAITTAYMAVQATTATRNLPTATPAGLSLAYETVAFESAVDHVVLRGWFLPSTGGRAVILLHGLESQRWDSYPAMPEKAQAYVKNGFNVLTFDLRAHGESGGDHVGLGWLERRDVAGAVDFLEGRGFPAGSIGIHGHSFGAGIALLSAAATPDIGAVLADSSFAAQRPLLDQEINRKTGLPPLFTPGITLFAGLFYGLDLDIMPPMRAVPEIAPRPILFVHGSADTRIPVENSRLLYSASHNPADILWIVAGAEHVQAFKREPDEYSARMLDFFKTNLR